MDDFKIPETTQQKYKLLAQLKLQLNSLRSVSSLKLQTKEWVDESKLRMVRVETYFAQIISTLTLDELVEYYKQSKHFNKALPPKGQLAILDKLLSMDEFAKIYNTLSNQGEDITNLDIKFIKVCLELLKLRNEVFRCGRYVTIYKKRVIEFADRFHFDPKLWLHLIEMG